VTETLDMRDTIIPKSDQLNADDLIGGPRTITITKVSRANTAEQPIAVSFDGDGGKPYFPCKSMRRVMVFVWGEYAETYVGRSMMLYRDAEVTWGGMAVGGIRISHMSHMDGPMVLALTATKKARKPYRVLPLVVEHPKEDRAQAIAASIIARVDAIETGEALYAIVDDVKVLEQRKWLNAKRPELATDVEAAFMAARQRTEEPASDGGMQG
jgi:hypothetical protein